MSYRLLNESRLDDETAEALVRFAWESTPKIERSTAIKLRDGSYPSGQAMPGSIRKWAGRARHALTTTVPHEGWEGQGTPRVCWHSTRATRYARALHEEFCRRGIVDPWEAAKQATYSWIGEQYDDGATHLGRWPIVVTATVEEAVVHTLAHELMHVLAADRQRVGNGDRYGQSELLCEEHAKRVLTDYQQATVKGATA